MTASVKKHQKCSQCENVVNEDNKIYLQGIETLEFLFPNVEIEDDDPGLLGSVASHSSSSIVVTTLSGECTTLSYNANQTIQNLKNDIEKELKIPCNKQCLQYHDIELKVLYP